MSTELAAFTPAEGAVEVVSVSSLEAWAEQAKAAAYIARSLAGTPFVPGSLRVAGDTERTTANVAAALLTGSELGLEPMAALRSIDVIQGTPALRAVALRALVQRAGHQIWLVESSKTQAVVRGKRRGDPEAQESKWTIERAKELGLASKDNWKKQPAAMLVARATAECCRLIASDVLLGLPYVAEEIGDPETEQTQAPAPAARRRTAQRKQVQVAREQGADETPAPAAAEPTQPDDPFNDEPVEVISADEPATPQPDDPWTAASKAARYGGRGVPATDAHLPDDEPSPPVEKPEPPPEPPKRRMINAAQRKLIMMQLGKLGIADDDDRHAVMSRVTGRQVDSTNHLTSAEAGAVIEELDAMQAAAEATDDVEDVEPGLFGDDA